MEGGKFPCINFHVMLYILAKLKNFALQIDYRYSHHFSSLRYIKYSFSNKPIQRKQNIVIHFDIFIPFFFSFILHRKKFSRSVKIYFYLFIILYNDYKSISYKFLAVYAVLHILLPKRSLRCIFISLLFVFVYF